MCVCVLLIFAGNVRVSGDSVLLTSVTGDNGRYVGWLWGCSDENWSVC